MRTHRAGPLAVHEYGEREAPVLLLLHGITDSGQCWADLVERLGSSYRIVAPDALGHGASDRFTPAQLAAGDTMEQMYASTVDLLETLGPALVIGHSMGGGVAGAVAARRPELVRAVVLEDPAWMDESPWGSDDEAISQRLAWARSVAKDPDAAIAQCRAEHPAWPESELGPWAQGKADLDREFLRNGLPELSVHWTEIAKAITVSTLVVTGDGDVILTPNALDEVRSTNPALETAVISGADHCVRRDQGDAFHAVVDPWLAVR